MLNFCNVVLRSKVATPDGSSFFRVSMMELSSGVFSTCLLETKKENVHQFPGKEKRWNSYISAIPAWFTSWDRILTNSRRSIFFSGQGGFALSLRWIGKWIFQICLGAEVFLKVG